MKQRLPELALPAEIEGPKQVTAFPNLAGDRVPVACSSTGCCAAVRVCCRSPKSKAVLKPIEKVFLV